VKLCEEDGCECSAIKKGMCHPHYARELRRNRRELRPKEPVKTCLSAGCTEIRWSADWCFAHQQQRVRSEVSARNPLVSFFRSVQAVPGDCWYWTKKLNEKGYGRFTADGRNRAAHKWLWEYINGPVPPGLELDHLCHHEDLECPGGNACLHRRCVNPAHLEPVEPIVNNERRLARLSPAPEGKQ
jgi:hypothetical protein